MGLTGASSKSSLGPLWASRGPRALQPMGLWFRSPVCHHHSGSSIFSFSGSMLSERCSTAAAWILLPFCGS